MTPIDIFITSYLRQAYTERTITYLEQRTKYPYRLFVIDNGGNREVLAEAIRQNKVFLVIRPSTNMGIHAAWNTALALAESEYFITSDNDIYVPDLEPDWLSQLVGFMDERPDYGAISLHPHVVIGDESLNPNDSDDVKDVAMCGAVMRIMRRQAVWDAGGWKDEGDALLIRGDRGKEERVICSRLKSNGWKTGRTTRLRAYH